MPDYKSYNADRTQKICYACKQMLDLNLFVIRHRIIKGKNYNYYSNICKNCSSLEIEKFSTTDKGIASRIVKRIRKASKDQNIPFDLDAIWVLDRLNQIDWKCELTGLPMISKRDKAYKDFHKNNTDTRLNAISIDRIDPHKGYVKSNVRFILNQVNSFKLNGTDERMFFIAEALLNFKNK